MATRAMKKATFRSHTMPKISRNLPSSFQKEVRKALDVVHLQQQQDSMTAGQQQLLRTVEGSLSFVMQ